MSVIDTLVNDIEAAVRGTGKRRRHALLDHSTRLLAAHHADLTDHDIAVFDDVIFSLIDDVDADDRSLLAERLADLKRAPKKTVRSLALDDDLAIAGPLILRCIGLDDETLINIIANKSREHIALMTRRSALSSAVITQLALHGEEAVLVDIARNDMIPISDETLRLLAERALSSPRLYRILRMRPDLAMRHVGAMIEAARYRSTTDRMARDFEDDRLSRLLAIETALKLADATTSLVKPNDDKKIDRPVTDDLDKLLDRNEIHEALIALAVQSGLSGEHIKRAYHAPQFEPFMYVLRGQDYPLTTMLRFMRHKHGVISEDLELQISTAYCALARHTAQRIALFMTDKANQSFALEDEALRHSA